MFSIDGIEWDFPCDIERVSEVRSSAISGLMLDKSWFNDVLGTYMSYTVTIAVPLNRRDDYARLYEAITAPADGHTFVFPYNSEQVTITARVKHVSDACVRLPGGGNTWKGIRFTAVSNYPTRALTLGETVTAGRAPMPAVSEPQAGEAYVYGDGGWERLGDGGERWY